MSKLQKTYPSSREAFENAVNKYWDKLTGIAIDKTNKEDGFDIVQDVLLSAWEKWEDLPKNEELEFYLLHAVKLRIFNYYRSSGRYQSALQKLELLLNGSAEENSPLEAEEFSHLRDAILEKAIQTLSPKQQQLFTLRLRQQYSYQKIAGILDIEPASARVMYTRALEQVKAYIKSNPVVASSLVVTLGLFTIS